MSPRSLPTRVRVSVVSNSMAVVTDSWGTCQQQFTYPRVLERKLRVAGLDGDVANFFVSFGVVSEAVCRWERVVLNRAPDVVIVHFGVLECSPKVLPRRLERLANGWHYHGSPTAQRTRRIVLRLWRYARAYQKLADRALGLHTWRMTPARFDWELRQFIALTQGVGSPLILVVDLVPFRGSFEYWIPNVNRRREQLQQVLERVAADSDGVELIRASSLATTLDPETATPDGVHYSVAMHELVAAEMERRVTAWLATQ